MNLQSEEYANNKSFCEDLTEGKFSFPIIHAIRHNPSDRRLINILKQRTDKDSIKMYAVQYMEQVRTLVGLPPSSVVSLTRSPL